MKKRTVWPMPTGLSPTLDVTRMTGVGVEIINELPKVRSLWDLPKNERYFRIGCFGCKNGVSLKVTQAGNEIREILDVVEIPFEEKQAGTSMAVSGSRNCESPHCGYTEEIVQTKLLLNEDLGMELD